MQSAISLWQISPSVCLSHSGVLSKRMHIWSNAFHHLVGAWPSFFRAPPPLQNFKKSRRRDRPMVTKITNRKSQVADRSVSVPMTLSDLERRDATGQIFRRISVNYAHVVWPTVTKFSVLIQVVEKLLSKGHPGPRPKGQGPSVSKILGPPTHARTQYEKRQPNFASWSNWMWGKFYRVDPECWRAMCLQ